MKLIYLSQGQVAKVDDADFDWLSKWKWCAKYDPTQSKYYAVRWQGKSGNLSMARAILGAVDSPLQVDHRNGDSLDNRRENLRLATPSQNTANRRKPKSNTSGFKGVGWSKDHKKWVAYYGKGCKKIGYFDTPEKAHEAYKAKMIEVFGEFARTE